MVYGIGYGSSKPTPANQATRPIALACSQFANERLISHGWRAFPFTLGITVIGNARIRTAACAGKHEQALMAAHEIGQRRIFRLCLNGTGWKEGHTDEMGTNAGLQQDQCAVSG